MQIEGPNDLIRLCYEYGIQEIPITRNGSIQAAIEKKDLVGYLNKRDPEDRDIRVLIDDFAGSVQSDFLSSLKEKLRDGTISGIPIINYDAEVVRTITPGVLRAEEESREFLDQALQKELYEKLFEQFPFYLELLQEEEVVFKNFEELPEDMDWTIKEWSEGNVTMKIYFPYIVLSLHEAYRDLRNGESIEMREVLDTIEEAFLEVAHHSTDSISEAAEQVGLPRQTFSYRWDNINQK